MLQKKAKAQDDLKAKTQIANEELNECYDQAIKFQDFGLMSELAEYLKKIKEKVS